MTSWARYRARRPARSKVTETAMTTILIALIAGTFATLLHTVLTHS